MEYGAASKGENLADLGLGGRSGGCFCGHDLSAIVDCESGLGRMINACSDMCGGLEVEDFLFLLPCEIKALNPDFYAC